MTTSDLARLRPPPPTVTMSDMRRLKDTVMALPALALWVAVVRSPTFDLRSSHPDEALFLLIGDRWLHGLLPYVEIWDVKPPGLFALFALAQGVVGAGVLAARILGAVAVFLSCCALYAFSRRHLGHRSIGLAAAAIYPAYSLILYGSRTCPELLFTPFVITGLDLALSQWKRRQACDPPKAIIAGLLFGLAVMIKQTAVFEAGLAAGLVAFASRRDGVRRFRPLPVILFGGAASLPTIGFLSYFLANGVPLPLILAPFTGAAHRLSGDGITFGGGLFRLLPMMKPLLPLFLGTVLLWAERKLWTRSDEADGLLALLWWSATSAAGVVAMRSMYFQYLVPLVPPFLLASLVVMRLYCLRIDRERVRQVAAVGVGLALIAYPVGWLALYEVDDAGWSHLPFKAVERMRALGLKPDDSLYVVDQETTAYVFAGARIPTRFPQSQHLVCDFTLPDVGQADEIQRIMASGPRFVLLSQQRPWMVCERSDRTAIVDAALRTGYQRVATVTDTDGGIDIFCRVGSCSP